MTPSCRLITVAWGEKHVRQLIEVALPALMAPGNLPALAAAFDCELMICTTADAVEGIDDSVPIDFISTYCPVLFRTIDEFVGDPNAYGMTLTWSLFRGFEDLGERMTDVQLVFFNADFVLADGSLGALVPLIRSGHRVIMAPSYCAIAEAALPLLKGGNVKPRDAARIAIANRHNTVRAKTVNQGFCGTRLQDQFYWVVDENTLLCRQFPMALVSMRPTRAVAEVRALWDYGVLSQFCPGVEPYVIADSDDFMMVELRDAEVARGQLRFGALSRREVAAGMASFVTDDTLPLGDHVLRLHSGDLPLDWWQAAVDLDRYVTAVLGHLPRREYECLDHPQWLYHAPAFERHRSAYLESPKE
jgi:hypothetical protein